MTYSGMPEMRYAVSLSSRSSFRPRIRHVRDPGSCGHKGERVRKSEDDGELMPFRAAEQPQLQPSLSTRKWILVPILETPRTRYFIWMIYVELHLTSSQFSEHGSQYTRASTHMYSTTLDHYFARKALSHQKVLNQLGTLELKSLKAVQRTGLSCPTMLTPRSMGVLDSGGTIPFLCLHLHLRLLKNLNMTDNNEMQSNNGYRNVNRRRELQESLNAVDSFLTSFRYPFPTFIQWRHRARWRHKTG